MIVIEGSKGDWKPLRDLALEVVGELRRGRIPARIDYFDNGSFGFYYKGRYLELFGNVLRVADRKELPFNHLVILKGPEIGRVRKKAIKTLEVRA